MVSVEPSFFLRLELTELMKPGERALDYPAMTSEF